MSVVAISFTSESGDHYTSLFTDIKSLDDLCDRLEEEYGDEFSYLYIDAVCTDDGSEEIVIRAVADRLDQAGDHQ